MTDPFEAVNAYVKLVMETAITFPVAANKPGPHWATRVELLELQVEAKGMHKSIERAAFEVREAVCNRLVAGKGLPEIC